MCRFSITDQPGYSLDAQLCRVPHSDTINLKLIQRFPTVSPPTDLVVLNVCLSRADIKALGHTLVCES